MFQLDVELAICYWTAPDQQRLTRRQRWTALDSNGRQSAAPRDGVRQHQTVPDKSIQPSAPSTACPHKTRLDSAGQHQASHSSRQRQTYQGTHSITMLTQKSRTRQIINKLYKNISPWKSAQRSAYNKVGKHETYCSKNDK